MADGRSAELLSLLPRTLAVDLRPHARPIAAAIIREVQHAVPAYSRPLVGGFGMFLTEAVEHAVVHCIEGAGNPQISDEEWLSVFRRRGRMEFTEGRDLKSIQAAARVGGHAAWRYLSPVLQRFGLPTEEISLLAEAIFAYIDELSATALEGYYEAQARSAGTPDVRRRHLLETIAATPASSMASIVSQANAIGWTVPERVAMVALKRADEGGKFPVELLDDEVLIDLESTLPHLLTADPERHLTALGECTHDWRIAISPVVGLEDAPAALRTARRALDLLDDDGEPLIWCRDHLATLWLLAEDFLAAELAKKALNPFEALSEKQRDRLSETLLTWLETRGGAPEIAKRLNVHPQTVRARLHQLEELFGDRLSDPDDRLDMQLALRAQRLMRKAEPTENSA